MDDLDELAAEIGRLATDVDLTVGVAESLTGGMVVQALARAEASSEWLRGGVVAYHRSVKYDLLGVDVGKVVAEDAAVAMAGGARRALGADVTIALTGVGGPVEQDGEPAGTVWMAVDDGDDVRTALRRFEGDPEEVCAQAAAAALTALRDRLADRVDPVERVGG